LDAATSQAAATPIAQPVARMLLDGFEQQHGALDPGQRALALAFATDPRLLTVGLGPAGAGKTTAMRAFAGIAEASGGG
jgi:ABC-type uncharacterized transport system ATPase subunit